LALAADSLDLVVLPHTLERSADPHACLREVERVLIPEGQVLITGLNPWSLWGWQQTRGVRQAGCAVQIRATLIGYRRLRDWLRLLGFEVQVSRFGGWTPALGSERWMQRLQWMDAGGALVADFGRCLPDHGHQKGARWALDRGRRWRTVRSPAVQPLPCGPFRHHHGPTNGPERPLTTLKFTPMAPAKAILAQAAGAFACSRASMFKSCLAVS
jgi:SAM-dependent methyltransferase